MRGDAAHPANLGRLCSKGSALAETLDDSSRLRVPTIAGREAGWDIALDLVARRFAETIAEHGPDAVAFYGSGQFLTEDYYVANKLMKGFIGSGNIDTNSRLCMASTVAGHVRAFGEDVVPGVYEDWEEADLVVLVGSNTAWCHPVLFQRLVAARAERGTKIVVIDPRRTATCDDADLHLPLAPGSDVALFAGLLNHIAEAGHLNQAWIEAHTNGLTAALDAARATDIARVTKLPQADIEAFYDLFVSTERVVTVFSQGVNQSSAGTDKVNAIINCHLATGRIGRPGMGPFSVTGQPNAMGGREVGGLANQLAAHMSFDRPADIDRVRRFWNAPGMAARPGLKAVDLFDAVGRGEVKAVWIMATNPVASLPDADAVRRALRSCELSIVSEAVRATDTVDACRIRLPALAWGEKDGTVTNSERCISRQRRFLPMPGEARQDWWIVGEVARRLGFGAAFDWKGPADIFREHAALSAFENGGRRAFDIGAHAGIADAAYDALAPFAWPARADGDARDDKRFFADGGFFHGDRRARFVATPARPPRHAPTAERPLRLNTGRVRDQWHTMTRTGKSARLAGHRPEPTIELHPRDAAPRGLQDGDIARVSSSWGHAVLRVAISDAMRPGEAFAPMHWTAQVSRAGAINGAVNPAVDPLSGQPELKHTPVEVQGLAMRWHGTILARRPVMLPDMTYWTRIKGAGFHAYLLAGEQPAAMARQALSASIRSSNPGPWREGGPGLGVVIADGRLEAALVLGQTRDPTARDRLEPFMALQRLGEAERAALLAGGPAVERGGELCACHGVSAAAVIAAIAGGALSPEAVGAVTLAGTNCGSCRTEIRALLRSGTAAQAA